MLLLQQGVNMSEVDLKKYQKFVLEVTSAPSKDLTEFMNRLDDLDTNVKSHGELEPLEYSPQVNVPLLLTAGIGLASEGGEFNEIVKKMFFQGKPLNDDNVFHMMRELGDIMWYWVNACTALGLDPNDVIAENVEKLKARYPGGEFNVWHSENRKEGDL
jgi:NTP pyrophosphatase (non-canonical NTP hydrolase)